jgi:hypothetical protein
MTSKLEPDRLWHHQKLTHLHVHSREAQAPHKQLSLFLQMKPEQRLLQGCEHSKLTQRCGNISDAILMNSLRHARAVSKQTAKHYCMGHSSLNQFRVSAYNLDFPKLQLFMSTISGFLSKLYQLNNRHAKAVFLHVRTRSYVVPAPDEI